MSDVQCPLSEPANDAAQVYEGLEDAFVRFPITCPICGGESLMTLRTVAVTVAVKKRRSMRLYASCHDTYWDASPVELHQISAYLGASWVGSV